MLLTQPHFDFPRVVNSLSTLRTHTHTHTHLSYCIIQSAAIHLCRFSAIINLVVKTYGYLQLSPQTSLHSTK
jgi:hypothetical protein